MGRRPKGDSPMTANERKQVQRLKDKRLLDQAAINPLGAPLRILLKLVEQGDEQAWQEIGRRNGWVWEEPVVLRVRQRPYVGTKGEEITPPPKRVTIQVTHEENILRIQPGAIKTSEPEEE